MNEVVAAIVQGAIFGFVFSLGFYMAWKAWEDRHSPSTLGECEICGVLADRSVNGMSVCDDCYRDLFP